jgi:hypothetical protein
MALDATVGGASSNSYVTLAEANTYFADRLNSTANGDWTNDSTGVARTDAVKSAALITATRRIDEEMFQGLKASTTQALKWPRVNVQDEDGLYFESDSIPERVKQATYICALELLKVDFISEDYLNNFAFFSAGNVQFKQFTQQSAGRLPAEVSRLLRFVMMNAGGGRLVRA